MVQLETVSSRTEPSEYLSMFDAEEKTIEIELGGDPRDKSVQVTYTDMLDPVIADIDAACIVKDGSDHYRSHEDAEWIVKVYDGYNE